jgi:hypothetical protein
VTLADITVSYVSSSNKLKFTGSSSFTVKSTGTASRALGFVNNAASSSNIVTSEYGIYIYGFTSLIIKSNALSVSRLSKKTDESVYEAILDNVAGEILIDEPNIPYEITVSNLKNGLTLSAVDFRLYDENGVYVNIGLNGKFKLFCLIETG